MRKMLITEVAREKKVARTTVLKWIDEGLFPGARLNNTGIVPFWEIPANEVQDFDPPKRGRPSRKTDKGKLAA